MLLQVGWYISSGAGFHKIKRVSYGSVGDYGSRNHFSSSLIDPERLGKDISVSYVPQGVALGGGRGGSL